MEKTAQKRNILDRLKEYTNIDGLAAEKFFDPELKRVMEELRKTDEEIREIVSGEHRSLEEKASLKGLVKLAESKYNRRQYMASIAYLELFNSNFLALTKLMITLKFETQDKVHDKFLFQGLSNKEKNILKRLQKKHASKEYELTKQGGKFSDFGDWLYSVTSKDGRALAFWEKRYPAKTEKLKKGISSIISSAKDLVELTYSNLKKMSEARNSRDVDLYIGYCDEVRVKFEEFNLTFTTIYNKDLKDIINKMQEDVPDAVVLDKPVGLNSPAEDLEPHDYGSVDIDPQSSVHPLFKENKFDKEVETIDPDKVEQKLPASDEATTQREQTLLTGRDPKAFQVYDFPSDRPAVKPEVKVFEPKLTPYQIDRAQKDKEMSIRQKHDFSVPPPSQDPMSGRVVVRPPTVRGVVPSMEKTVLDQTPPAISSNPEDTERSPATKPGVQSLTHAHFFNAIEKMGNSDPKVLNLYIRKYAKAIELYDLETSIKLLKVAAKIG